MYAATLAQRSTRPLSVAKYRIGAFDGERSVHTENESYTSLLG